MNKFLEILEIIQVMPRQVGKTYALVKWAQEHNGTIICANANQAQLIRATYKVKAVSLYDLDKLRGTFSPVQFDHCAVESLLQEANSELKKQENSDEIYKLITLAKENERLKVVEAEYNELKEHLRAVKKLIKRQK